MPGANKEGAETLRTVAFTLISLADSKSCQLGSFPYWTVAITARLLSCLSSHAAVHLTEHGYMPACLEYQDQSQCPYVVIPVTLPLGLCGRYRYPDKGCTVGRWLSWLWSKSVSGRVYLCYDVQHCLSLHCCRTGGRASRIYHDRF